MNKTDNLSQNTRPDYYRVDVENMRIPELCDALSVWQSKCRNESLPVWGDLDFLDFDPKILPRMILLDVDHDPGFGTYRYWGTRVASFNGVDMTGLRVSGLEPARHANYSEEEYRWVVDHARPALFVACLANRPGIENMKRSCGCLAVQLRTVSLIVSCRWVFTMMSARPSRIMWMPMSIWKITSIPMRDGCG